MGELRPGMTVPMRKAKLNPWTHSGRPLWNTYAALDYVGTTKQLNRMRRHPDVSAVMPTRRDMPAVVTVRLCKSMNKAILSRDRVQYHFDQARRLSLRIDQATDGLDDMLAVYNEHVYQLQHAPSKWYLNELIRLEAARGVVRASRS